MRGKTKVFVSYKKLKPDGSKNNIGFELKNILESSGRFDVFIDSYLYVGEEWEPTIYKELISSHVVLVAVSENISESMWVEREVSIAKAFNIRVIPVKVSISDESFQREVEKLRLAEVQYNLRELSFNSQSVGMGLEWLEEPLVRARASLEQRGRVLLNEISQKVQPTAVPAKPSRSVKSLRISSGEKPRTLHIAAGDMFQHGGYDVIVNSENSLLQMARLIDGRSVSAQLRYLGSGGSPDTFDAVQKELDFQASTLNRPALPGTVIVTSSGDPKAMLHAGLKTRYIFHAVSTQAEIGQVGEKALSEDWQIAYCINNIFQMVQELVDKKGIISPANSESRRLQEIQSDAFTLNSMLIPIIGSGRGGKTVSQIAPIILRAAFDFLASPECASDRFPLSDIHLAAFLEDDVIDCERALGALTPPA